MTESERRYCHRMGEVCQGVCPDCGFEADVLESADAGILLMPEELALPVVAEPGRTTRLAATETGFDGEAPIVTPVAGTERDRKRDLARRIRKELEA